jgi:hypothetical protein
MLIITLHACERGKEINFVIVVIIGTKVIRSQDLGTRFKKTGWLRCALNHLVRSMSITKCGPLKPHLSTMPTAGHTAHQSCTQLAMCEQVVNKYWYSYTAAALVCTY